MKSNISPNMKTLGIFSPKQLKDLVKQLENIKELKKIEYGSFKDIDGHSIIFQHNNMDIFFAMIHSSRKNYLVRAEKDLFVEVHE